MTPEKLREIYREETKREPLIEHDVFFCSGREKRFIPTMEYVRWVEARACAWSRAVDSK